MIIHAKHMWPDVIDASLWTYEIRLSGYIDNSTIQHTTFNSHIEEFANVAVRAKLRHFHPFRCPAYVLIRHDRTKISKWDPKSKIGVYIGSSPKHARSVHLILNPSTGLTSPQYHMRFDDLFQTTTNMHVRFNWKVKCHFVKELTYQDKAQCNESGTEIQILVNNPSLDTNTVTNTVIKTITHLISINYNSDFVDFTSTEPDGLETSSKTL
jgi:hypothetical protein